MSKEDSNPYTEVSKQMVSIWEEFSEQMEKFIGDLASKEDYSELHQRWKEYQDKAVDRITDMESLNTPESISNMFKEWMELSAGFGEVLKSYHGPKLPEEVNELFEGYMKQIREPILKTLSMSLKDQFNKQQELYSLWIDSFAKVPKDDDIQVLTDFIKDKWMESASSMSADLMDAFKEGKVEGVFHKMEREWLKTSSEMVQKILLSRPYAMAQGTYVDNILDSRITQRELMDSYLKSMGMPTRDDMLKLYESVHELTSRIRSIERKLENIPLE